MEISANAKINLTLDILRRREDGYHELQMVMQAVSLADQLTVVPARGTEGTAASDLHFLPTGGKNLAQMAAAAFRAATGLGGPVDVTIQKRVPVCAGLAGGSADAAAVLRAMDELTGAGLSPVELAKIGEGVGSDVPFCVLGGTALAEGRGERLPPLPPSPPCSASPPCRPARKEEHNISLEISGVIKHWLFYFLKRFICTVYNSRQPLTITQCELVPLLLCIRKKQVLQKSKNSTIVFDTLLDFPTFPIPLRCQQFTHSERSRCLEPLL